jgi:hypothetical protein
MPMVNKLQVLLKNNDGFRDSSTNEIDVCICVSVCMWWLGSPESVYHHHKDCSDLFCCRHEESPIRATIQDYRFHIRYRPTCDETSQTTVNIPGARFPAMATYHRASYVWQNHPQEHRAEDVRQYLWWPTRHSKTSAHREQVLGPSALRENNVTTRRSLELLGTASRL